MKKVVEQKRLKCAQYWPLEMGQILKLRNIFEIANTDVEDLNDYKISKLIIKYLPVSIEKLHYRFYKIIHYYFQRVERQEKLLIVNFYHGQIMEYLKLPLIF